MEGRRVTSDGGSDVMTSNGGGVDGSGKRQSLASLGSQLTPEVPIMFLIEIRSIAGFPFEWHTDGNVWCQLRLRVTSCGQCETDNYSFEPLLKPHNNSSKVACDTVGSR